MGLTRPHHLQNVNKSYGQIIGGIIMKVNSGTCTKVEVAGKTFEIDGYLLRSKLEPFISRRTRDTLPWTNLITPDGSVALGFSCFMHNEQHEAFEITDIYDIDPQEQRTFSSYKDVGEAIETFVSNTNH